MVRDALGTEYYNTEKPVAGTDVTFSVWAPKAGSNLPVVIFQSGYSGSSEGHRFFLENVAKEGFIVVAPDSAADGRQAECTRSACERSCGHPARCRQ